jgi:hypothetical protein
MRGITKPDFRPCSACPPRSQAPFCLYTLGGVMSIHPEGTFGRLRYALGGDRPSQTTRLALSAARFTGFSMRYNTQREWYFTAVSRTPTRMRSTTPTYPTHVLPHIQTRV